MPVSEWVPELDKLREIVDASGLTRNEVAERADLSPGDLSRFLAGRRPGASFALFRRVLLAVEGRWSRLDELELANHARDIANAP